MGLQVAVFAERVAPADVESADQERLGLLVNAARIDDAEEILAHLERPQHGRERIAVALLVVHVDVFDKRARKCCRRRRRCRR